MTVYGPQEERGRRELEERVAELHAQTVVEILRARDVPPEAQGQIAAAIKKLRGGEPGA